MLRPRNDRHRRCRASGKAEDAVKRPNFGELRERRAAGRFGVPRVERRRASVGWWQFVRAGDKGERRDVAQRRLEPLNPLAEDGIGLVRAVEAEDAEAAVGRWSAGHAGS